jgi:hypothetical protein
LTSFSPGSSARSSVKRQSLSELGDHLDDYQELQRIYNRLIHIPDHASFAGQWERTLYAPLRQWAGRVPDRSGHFVYLAPGSRAPTFSEGGPFRSLQAVTLMEIDAEVLKSALARTRGSVDSTCSVSGLLLDFTAGLGQKLCGLFAAPFGEGRAADSGLFRNPEFIADALIPGDTLAGLGRELETAARSRGLSRDATVCLSEMVASFTGTAPLMGFRTALYRRWGSCLPPGEIEGIFHRATQIWRHYNEKFFVLHLRFLSAITRNGGQVLVAVDTEKRFENGLRPPALTYLGAEPPLGEVPSLRLISASDLVWHDHSESFDVAVAGIPVPDFQSHTHTVKLYVFEKSSGS